MRLPATSSFLWVFFKAYLASFQLPDGNKESYPCRLARSSTTDRCTETKVYFMESKVLTVN